MLTRRRLAARLLAPLVPAALLGAQDGDRRPKPPAGAAPLPPIAEPPSALVDRSDLIQRFASSELNGTYRLVATYRDGVQVRSQQRGYMMIGYRYLSFHLQADADGGMPAMLQSGFRAFRVEGDRLVTTTLLGLRGSFGDRPQVDTEGISEVRTLSLTATTLRISQSAGDYLEFERID
jgi:hypothetical protein